MDTEIVGTTGRCLNASGETTTDAGLAAKMKLLLRLLVTSAFCQVAFADSGGILTNLLDKVRSLKSYHFKIDGRAILDPKDSGYGYRMELRDKSELWAKRLKNTSLLSQTGNLSVKPIEHPEAIHSVSNIIVYDGTEYFHVEYQDSSASAVRFKDPNHTCRIFDDAETTISVLLQDASTRYVGRTNLNSRTCQVFQSSATFFAGEITADHVSVEVALDEKTGLPARTSCKTDNSWYTVVFQEVETNPKINGNRFKPPAGVRFRTAQPDGRGGWQRRLTDP